MSKVPILRQELRKLGGSLQYQKQRFSELLSSGQLISDLHNWTKNSLATTHLVDVALALDKELDISIDEMAFLEVPVDILEDFPNWRAGSREGFSPRSLGVKLPKLGASAPVGMFRLQLSPFSTTLSAAVLLLRRLIESVDEDVQFHVAVEPGGDMDALHKIISSFHPTAGERVHFSEIQTASVFAQDNARAALSESGAPAMMIPRGFRKERARGRDSLDGKIKDINGLEVFRSRLFWEGGNILSDEKHCFIGVDHLRENMQLLGLSREEVITLFHSEFGESVSFLGDFEATCFEGSDMQSFLTAQASFHLDLDVSLLGKPRADGDPVALLAAPEISLKHIEEVLSLKRLVRDHFLDESDARRLIEQEYRMYGEERVAKLKQYRERLAELGYRIVDVPDLRIDPQDNLFSTRNLDFIYCNVLPGLVRGQRSILHLSYGIPVLDNLAKAAYQEAGCQSIQVSETGRLANLLMLFRGGLRCVCSQVS